MWDFFYINILFWCNTYSCLHVAAMVRLEYAYVMAPQSMQGVIIGIFWTVDGVGFFMATVMQYAVIHVPCVCFDASLRDLCIACCSSLFIWTIILGIRTFYLPLGLENVIVIGDMTNNSGVDTGPCKQVKVD